MAKQEPVASVVALRSWAAVNSIGFGLAFLSFIPGMLLIDLFLPQGLTNLGSSSMPDVLDPEALPAWLDPQTYRAWYRMHLGYHVVALAVFGGIVGWFQSLVVRRFVPVLPWVAATATGVVAILCFEIVERHVVVGPHAGPVEPLMISIGGSTLAGFAQWLVLRQRGVNAGRWLGSWILGVALGVGVAVGTIIGVEMAVTALIDVEHLGEVGRAVAWGTMLFMLGSVMGAVAGAFSARALSSALGGRDI